ncbi:MAG: hypothetical protein Q8O67_08420 [Deltaproteobacteria bacterium]|nr:hypothetical protein [Deltaproteobacteria bacterium]
MKRALGLPLFVVLAIACEPEPIANHLVEIDVDGDGSVLVLPDDQSCEEGDPCSLRYDAGSFVSLIARPAQNQVFLGWGGDCGDSGTNRVIDLDVVADVSCSARFEPDPVVVAEGPLLLVDVLGPGIVTSDPAAIDCSGTDAAHAVCEAHFVEGSFVTLQANPVPGASFIGFSGDCADLDNGDGTAGVFLDRDTSCGVTFIEDDIDFPVRIEVEGQGTVTSTPSGISCGPDGSRCEALFGPTDDLTLDVLPDDGWIFAGWGHTCEIVGTEPSLYIGPVTFGLACSARFTRTFFIEIDGEGTVTAETDDGPFTCDRFDFNCQTPSVPSTLTATPVAGSRFVRWNGDCAGTTATVDVDVDDVRCIAVFERLPPTLTVEIDGPGQVVSEPELDIDCPGDCTAEGISGGGGVDPGPGVWVCPLEYISDGTCDCGCGIPDPDCEVPSSSICDFCNDGCGDSCSEIAPDDNHLCVIGGDPNSLRRTLRAIPDDDSVFVGWSGDCFGSNLSTAVSTTEQATCVATFAAGIEIVVVGRGSVRTSDFDTCTSLCGFAPLPASLTAIPAATNVRFVGWSGDCAGAALTVTVDVDDRSCQATFEDIPSQIEVSVVGPGAAFVPTDNFTCDDACTLSTGSTAPLARVIEARPDDGAVFVRFSGDCTPSSAVPTTTNTITATSPVVKSCVLTFAVAVELSIVDALGDLAAPVLALGRDGSELVAVDDNNNVELIDTATGFTRGRFNLGNFDVFEVITQAVIDDGDGSILLIDDDQQEEHLAYVMDALDPADVVPLVGHSARITGGVLDDAGVLAFTCDALGRVKIWNRAAPGLVQRTLVAHTGSAVGVGFTAGFVVSAGVDGRVVTHRTNSSTLVNEQSPFAGAAITAVASSSSGRVLVGAADGSLALYAVDAGGLLALLQEANVGGPVASLTLAATVATALVGGELLALDPDTLVARNLGPASTVASSSSSILLRESSGAVKLLSADGLDQVQRRFAVDVGSGFRSTAIIEARPLMVSSDADGLFVVDDARTVVPSIRGRDLAPAAPGFVFAANTARGIDRVSTTTGTATRVVDDGVFYLRIASNPSRDLIAATLFSFTADNDRVRVIEAVTGDRFRGFTANADAVDVAFLDDDTLVFLLDAGSTGTLRIVRISDATTIDDVALAFSPARFVVNGTGIVVGGSTSAGRGRVVRVDASNRANLVLGTVVDVESEVSAVTVFGGGVVAARANGSVGVVDVVGNLVHPPTLVAPLPDEGFFDAFNPYVFDLDVFQGDVLASTVDGVVRLER